MAVQTYTQASYNALYERLARNHTQTFLPAFHKAFGSLRGKRLLDVGCGDGRISYALAQRGATVTAVDVSAQWIASAQRAYHHARLTFQHLDARSLTQLPHHHYDVVLMNMVFINVNSLASIRHILQGVRQVLTPRGTFAFSDLHPACVMGGPHPDRWFTFAPNFSYFTSGGQFKAHIRLSPKTNIHFTNRHWNLETYSTQLRRAGFTLTGIHELARTARLPHARQYRVPEFILFTAQEQGHPRKHR